MPDAEWGERVAAAVVLRPTCALAREAPRDWARRLLAPSKVPTWLVVCRELARHAMGTMPKAKVRELFGPAPGESAGTGAR